MFEMVHNNNFQIIIIIQQVNEKGSILRIRNNHLQQCLELESTSNKKSLTEVYTLVITLLP